MSTYISIPSAALAKMNSIQMLEEYFNQHEETSDVLEYICNQLDAAIEGGATKCTVSVAKLNDDNRFAFDRYFQMNGYKIQTYDGDTWVLDWTDA